MATKQATAAEPVEKTTQAAVENPASAAPVFRIDKLRRYCLELFGVTPSTFDGATDGLTGEYSIDHMKDHIKKWLDKEVKI